MTKTGILEQYEVLLREYDRVLSISKMILEKLERREEDNHIIDLLEQKRIIAENIVDLTRKISVTEIKDRKDPNLQNLPKAKALLSQIAEKTKQIQKTEEKIQSFL
ncbi:MAG TPA: hypothetical protein VF369_01235 [candidate division Zixibacteria bacterium]